MTPPTTHSKESESPGVFKARPVLRPRQQVEEQIRRAILSGQFSPNERLPSEAKLAEQFAVSRATVREALRALEENGLIVKSPGAKGGSFVRQVDHHGLSAAVSERLTSTLELGSITYEEVAEFRNFLEIPSVRLAAQHHTADHLAALREIIDLEKAASVDDPQVPELNARFHTVLGEASGNRVLASFVAALHRVTHPLAYIERSAVVGQQSVRHHIAIYSAIEQGDLDAAEVAMQKHLDYLRKQVW